MALLYTTEPGLYGLPSQIVGIHYEEGLTGPGEIDIVPVINSDYLEALGATELYYVLSAKIVPLCFIQSYSISSIKTFQGNPPRAKFGQISMRHLNTYEQEQFITVEKQVFPNRDCLVSPAVLPFPEDMSALPPVITYESIYRSRPYGIFQSVFLDSDYLIADGISYYLEPQVVANIGFFYYAYINNAGTEPISAVLYTGI